eukprot:scaffold9298_cov93-Isochrysis_galbana.AAC.4
MQPRAENSRCHGTSCLALRRRGSRPVAASSAQRRVLVRSVDGRGDAAGRHDLASRPAPWYVHNPGGGATHQTAHAASVAGSPIESSRACGQPAPAPKQPVATPGRIGASAHTGTGRCHTPDGARGRPYGGAGHAKVVCEVGCDPPSLICFRGGGGEVHGLQEDLDLARDMKAS